MLNSIFWTLMNGNPVTLKFVDDPKRKRPSLQLFFNLDSSIIATQGEFSLRDEKGEKQIGIDEVKKLLQEHLNDHLQYAIEANLHDLAKEIQKEIEWIQFEM